MKLVGLVDSKISTDYAQKPSWTLNRIYREGMHSKIHSDCSNSKSV